MSDTPHGSAGAPVDSDVDLHVPAQRAELRRAPWAILSTNVSGCLLIGVLMVLVTEVWTTHRLLRPFLGTGVLGGYTTFSTYAVDAQHLIAAGAPRTALLYLAR